MNTVHPLLRPENEAHAKPVRLFNSPGHQLIAGDLNMTLFDGSTADTDTANLTLNNPTCNVSYAQAVSLAGDYFAGTSRTNMTRSISGQTSAADQQAVFEDKLSSLKNQYVLPLGSSQPVADLLAGIAEETTLVKAAQAKDSNGSWRAYFNPYGDEGQDLADYIDRGVVTDAISTVGYALISAFNYDHFGQDAITAYKVGHAYACQLAAQAQTDADLMDAYLANAYADHFLTDLFSSGHMRVPRREIPGTIGVGAVGGGVVLAGLFYMAGFLVKYMHDEDSALGLKVSNANGDQWVAYGDKRAYDDCNAQNISIARQAVQASIAEVYAAFTSKSATPANQALNYVPDLSSVVSAYPLQQPMFKMSGETVEARDPITSIGWNTYEALSAFNLPLIYEALDGYTAFGINWSTPKAIDGASGDWGGVAATAIAYGGATGVMATWCQHDVSSGSKDEQVYAAFSADGEVFTSAQKIDGLSTYENRPAVVLTDTTLTVGCVDEDYEHLQVCTVSLPISSLPITSDQWTQVGTSFPMACKYGGPIMVQMEDSTYVLWCDHDEDSTGKRDTMIALAEWNGSTLLSKVSLSHGGIIGTYEIPPAAAMFDDQLWMLWAGYSDYSLWFSSSATPTDAWSWSQTQLQAPSSGSWDTTFTRAAPALTEHMGDLWAAWYATDGNVYVSKMSALTGDATDPDSSQDDVVTTYEWSAPSKVSGVSANGTGVALCSTGDDLLLFYVGSDKSVSYVVGTVNDPI